MTQVTTFEAGPIASTSTSPCRRASEPSVLDDSLTSGDAHRPYGAARQKSLSIQPAPFVRAYSAPSSPLPRPLPVPPTNALRSLGQRPVSEFFSPAAYGGSRPLHPRPLPLPTRKLRPLPVPSQTASSSTSSLDSPPLQAPRPRPLPSPARALFLDIPPECPSILGLEDEPASSRDTSDIRSPMVFRSRGDERQWTAMDADMASSVSSLASIPCSAPVSPSPDPVCIRTSMDESAGLPLCVSSERTRRYTEQVPPCESPFRRREWVLEKKGKKMTETSADFEVVLDALRKL